jgi:hypothetical protein
LSGSFGIRELQTGDEKKIFGLYEAMPMDTGGFRLVYDRSPEFSRLLGYQSSNHRTYAGFKGEKLCAFGSLSWGPRFVGGKMRTVAYLGDLRAVFDRETARGWRGFYGDLVERVLTEPEFGPSAHLFTAILKENAAALRSLVSRRKGNGFEYRLLKEITMVNVLFRKPWQARRFPRAWKLERGISEAELRAFLSSCEKRKLFGYAFDAAPDDELARRRAVWPGCDPARFLVVRDQRGELLACTLPFAPSEAKRMRITRAALPARLAFLGLGMLGAGTPKVGESLKTLYLSHLCFAEGLGMEARASAVSAFLDELYDRGMNRGYQLVSLCDQHKIRSGLDRFFTLKTDVQLFEVGRPGFEPASVPEEGIGFEMALV